MWYYKVNCAVEFSATSGEIAADAVVALLGGDAAAVQEALLSPVEEIFAPIGVWSRADRRTDEARSRKRS